MVIREAKETDLEGLVCLNRHVQQMHVDLAPDLYCETDDRAVSKWFKEQLREKGNSTFVAEIDGRVLGYALVRMVQRPAHVFCYDRSCAYLDQICIDPDHRRAGVARELLQAVIAKASAAGMTRLELDVRSDNESAKASFRAMGFTTYSEKMEMVLARKDKS